MRANFFDAPIFRYIFAWQKHFRLHQGFDEHAARTVVVALLLFMTMYSIPIHCVPTKNILSPSRQQAHAIGQRLWQNECNKSIVGLTSWNKGELFASLGIGHFIWFPVNCSAPFTQTFPLLCTFLTKHSISLPSWLVACSYCPWQSREEFIAAADSAQMKELRALLSTTIDLQVLFIVERMQKALPAMLKNRPLKLRNHIKKQFYRVAQSPNGLYVLIDYINFKGEGINVKERYNGQGWGLMQVLESMSDISVDKNILEEFAQAAGMVLSMRVQHAPNKELEQRFLPGWLNRVKTYTHIQ